MAVMKAVGDGRKPAQFTGHASDPPEFIQAILGRCWKSKPRARDSMENCVEALSDRLLAMATFSDADFTPSEIVRLPKDAYSDSGPPSYPRTGVGASGTFSRLAARIQNDRLGTVAESKAEYGLHHLLQPKTSEAQNGDLTHVLTRNPSSISFSLTDAKVPRRLPNASTPGTYIMPSPTAPGTTTTLKMTPSLVMSRHSSVFGTPSPSIRFPSLLVSGVSGGEQFKKSTAEVGAGTRDHCVHR